MAIKEFKDFFRVRSDRVYLFVGNGSPSYLIVPFFDKFKLVKYLYPREEPHHREMQFIEPMDAVKFMKDIFDSSYYKKGNFQVLELDDEDDFDVWLMSKEMKR